jgi:phytanoyl-CoA dioxygenase PhyH
MFRRIAAAYADTNRVRSKTDMTTLINSIRRGVPTDWTRQRYMMCRNLQRECKEAVTHADMAEIGHAKTGPMPREDAVGEAQFDAAWYLREYPDVAEAVRAGYIKSALDHYLSHGRTEGRRGTPNSTTDSSQFDAVWYAKSYPLAAEESSPTDAALLERHYNDIGRHRGYKPNPKALRPKNAAAMPSPYGGLWIDQANALDLIRGKYELGNITADEARDLESFVLDGYVVLKNAVSSVILDRATEVLEAAYEGRYPEVRFECPAIALGHLSWQAKMSDLPGKALDLHWHVDKIRDLGFAPAVVRFLHLLFERPASISQSLGFYRGSAQGMHQDSAYVAYSIPEQFSAAWFALEDVKPDAGELMYFVESHRKLPELTYAERFKSIADAEGVGVSVDRLLEEDVKHLNAIESEGQRLMLKRETFMAKRGDVLIWHAELAHGGRPISTRASRKSVVFHYSPKEIVPLYCENRSVQLKRHSPGCYYTSGVYLRE